MTGQCDSASRWYIAMTLPRAEQAIAEALKDAGIQAYLPVEKVRRTCRSGRRTVRRDVTLPLFPGYIFVRLAEVELARLRDSEGIKGVLGGPDGRPLAVPDKEVKRIRLAEATGQYDRVPKPRDLKAGEVLEVCRGPFLGYRAEYLSHVAGDRVKVLMRAAEAVAGGRTTTIAVGDLDLLAA